MKKLLLISILFISVFFVSCSKMQDSGRGAGGDSGGTGGTTPPDQSTTTSNFNGTAIPANKFIWFNAHFKATGIVDGTVITVTGQSITSTNPDISNLNAPSSTITFSSSAITPSYIYSAADNMWNITIPLSGSDEIFLGGLTLPSGSGVPGGIKSIGWTATFGSSTPGVSLQWQWGAAVFNTFSTDYNALNVLLVHSSDHAGTPRAFAYNGNVYGGATGGAGSNYTGSWSGTNSVTIK